jgi:hypothetical protein
MTARDHRHCGAGFEFRRALIDVRLARANREIQQRIDQRIDEGNDPTE